ncbi:mitochondrial inner membrane protease subunit 1-like isoform X2 [Durio zibethinus]|uniref:Mitochondrial inner membrane protease subunit 1-like isoform X2 n=1 Tax=Durio zibethinus TaxID=66656 RepID=A0A6P5XX79_DURZI|nr:mitochondrial inner membrane protease subunit 1-like isoform X2 [Durio zibethinus]XP_022732806.1 mitochondrial inner membrane protease subunit 1-like isoform X2 [Durio zibethinus]XP_022732807.1 mitochondrial inner membrane protease subunit 1-like isoform X2 [Durio zibethinus]XP_022732808.1 mitochondrial inner membrane protease subunit 1-like isoform X2 [Durio zibethinus]
MRQWMNIAKEAIARASIVVKFICLLHVTDAYLLSSSHVLGPSMLPTLNTTGDVVLVENLSHRIGKLGSGDLVLVRSPLDPKKSITKRIIAMEGDKVTFSARNHSFLSLVVPKGHVWIQGDNLYVSRDSREFGPIPYGLIQGKVFFRVWPPKGFGSLGQ